VAGNALVSLSWTASSGATSYKVQRSGTSGSGYAILATTMGSSYSDNNVVNGTTYFYVVSALNAGGESAISQQATARPTAPISAQELNSSGLSISGSTATLTVPASVIGHTYQLQYTDNLATGGWQNVGTAQVGTAGSLQFTAVFDSSAPKRFYRIMIQP